jgi:hypothetical protein
MASFTKRLGKPSAKRLRQEVGQGDIRMSGCNAQSVCWVDQKDRGYRFRSPHSNRHQMVNGVLVHLPASSLPGDGSQFHVPVTKFCDLPCQRLAIRVIEQHAVLFQVVGHLCGRADD